MKFVVDGMLGSLARWLRMLGQEVVYDSKADDNSLLELAGQGMILLTRDEELHGRARARKLSSLLVSGKREEERLAEVARKLRISLEIDMATTRCPECDGKLLQAPKNEVVGMVPAQSLKLYQEFWKCENPECGKVYWLGSHWERIRRTLAEARRLAGHM